MKNSARISMAAVLMAAKLALPGGTAQAASHDLKLGVEGGIGWAQQGNTMKDGWTDEGSRSGGLVLDYGSQRFGIRPSVLLTQRNETYHKSSYADNGNGTQTLVSRIDDPHTLTQLEIPLLIRVDLPGEVVRPMVVLGPRLMIPLSDESSSSFKGDWTGNNCPLGLSAGLGLEVPFDNQKEAAQVQLRYDLNGDQMQSGNSGEIKLMVGLGFNIWHGIASSQSRVLERQARAQELGQGHQAGRELDRAQLVTAYKDLRMVKAMASEGLIDDQEFLNAKHKLVGKAFEAPSAAAPEPATLASVAMELPPDPSEPGVLPSAKIVEGRKLYAQGRYEQAEQYFRWLSEEKPADAEPLRYLGNCLWAQGRQQEAADVLAKAAELSPQAPALGLWLKSKGY